MKLQLSFVHPLGYLVAQLQMAIKTASRIQLWLNLVMIMTVRKNDGIDKGQPVIGGQAEVTPTAAAEWEYDLEGGLQTSNWTSLSWWWLQWWWRSSSYIGDHWEYAAMGPRGSLTLAWKDWVLTVTKIMLTHVDSYLKIMLTHRLPDVHVKQFLPLWGEKEGEAKRGALIIIMIIKRPWEAPSLAPTGALVVAPLPLFHITSSRSSKSHYNLLTLLKNLEHLCLYI